MAMVFAPRVSSAGRLDRIVARNNVITIPVALATMANNTVKQLPDGSSLWTSSVANSGLWLLKDGGFRQLIDKGKSWVNFVTLPDDRVLISSSDSAAASQGLYVYNPTNESLGVFYDSGYGWANHKNTEKGETVISSNNAASPGILYCANGDAQATLIYATGYDWVNMWEWQLGIALSSNNSSSPGLIQIQRRTKTPGSGNTYAPFLADRVIATGYGWIKLVDVDVGQLIGSTVSASTGVYFLSFGYSLYSLSQLSQLYASGYNWIHAFEFDGGALLSSSVSGNTGVLRYLSGTELLERKYTSGYKWSAGISMGTMVAMSSTDGTTAGILTYDALTDTFAKPYTSGTAWPSFARCALGCVISGGTGILRVRADTGACDRLLSSGVYPNLLTPPGAVLCSGSTSSNTGIKIYNDDTDTVTDLANATNNYAWTNVIDQGDVWLISSASVSAGIVRYVLATKTATRPHTAGYNWTNAVPWGDGVLVSGDANATGLLWIDAIGAATLLISAGTAYQYMIDMGDCVLVSSSSSVAAAAGLYRVDPPDAGAPAVTKIYDSGYGYAYIDNWALGYIIASNVSTLAAAMLLYNKDLGAAVTLAAAVQASMSGQRNLIGQLLIEPGV